jgi:hypothetical protein
MDNAMMFNRITLGLSLVLGLAVVGCGGDDPLTGTWTNTTCYGSTSLPDGIESCTTALTFSADLAFALEAKQFSEPATVVNPGCTTLRAVKAQTWSTDGDTFSLAGTGTATMERSSCVTPTDESQPAATSDISIPKGSSAYTIAGDALTIASGSLAGTYKR